MAERKTAADADRHAGRVERRVKKLEDRVDAIVQGLNSSLNLNLEVEEDEEGNE